MHIIGIDSVCMELTQPWLRIYSIGFRGMTTFMSRKWCQRFDNALICYNVGVYPIIIRYRSGGRSYESCSTNKEWSDQQWCGEVSVGTAQRRRTALHATGSKMLRWGQGNTKKDRVRTENIGGNADVTPTNCVLIADRLSWFGHIMRMEDSHLAQTNLY